MYSAVKVDGQRLYDLARQGIEVERKARPITVHSLVVTRVVLPDIDMHVECSKGTYIRTLAADLGEALGCGAHLAALRRTRSGPFTLAESVPLQELIGDRSPAETLARVQPHLLKVERGFEAMPAFRVQGEAQLAQVTHGQQLPLGAEHVEWAEGLRVRVLGPGEALIALAERQGDRLRYLRVLIGPAASAPST
jgi:tRNA pseudouridine55 synthase